MYLFHVFCIEHCLYKDIHTKSVSEVSIYLEQLVFKTDLTDQTRIRKWVFKFLYLLICWQTLVYKTEGRDNPNTVIFLIRNNCAVGFSRKSARKTIIDQIIWKTKVIRDNISVAGLVTQTLEHLKTSGYFVYHLV